MRIFVACLSGLLVLAVCLPWTASVVGVGAAGTFFFSASLARLRRATSRARHRAEVAQFRWHDDISPLEFEQRCAEALRQAGWQARTTKGSGDQGVDVLAERAGVRVALQCKRYGRTVGNKAVQEVLSGRAFYDAQHGIVVSNAGFSTAARELAEKTGIRLMHFSQMRTINEIFGLQAVPEPALEARMKWMAYRLETGRHRLALWTLVTGVALLVAIDHDVTIFRAPGAGGGSGGASAERTVGAASSLRQARCDRGKLSSAQQARSCSGAKGSRRRTPP